LHTKTLDALKFARDRIGGVPHQQLPRTSASPMRSRRTRWRWSAVDAVGLYVPAATAA